MSLQKHLPSPYSRYSPAKVKSRKNVSALFDQYETFLNRYTKCKLVFPFLNAKELSLFVLHNFGELLEVSSLLIRPRKVRFFSWFLVILIEFLGAGVGGLRFGCAGNRFFQGVVCSSRLVLLFEIFRRLVLFRFPATFL